MGSSLSNLFDNLSEETIKLYVNIDTMIKNVKIAKLNISITTVFLNTQTWKRWNKCLCFDQIYQQKFHEKVKEQFFNIYKFSSHDNNKFILLFWKDDYFYEYITDWGKFSETWLPVKEDFYGHLNVEDITDADNVHAKRVCKDFETKFFGEYRDLYVQINTLLLADVFENFQNMCLEILKCINLMQQNVFQLHD